MMVYNAQSYRVFGLCPSSGILHIETRTHNVLETGFVSVLRLRVGEDTYSVGSLRKS
jgi:hypothetical protein